MERADQILLWSYDNDLELAMLWGEPAPISKAALEARFDATIAETEPSFWFVIQADDRSIGVCDLMDLDHTAGTCTIGIAIGDRAYWGKGHGRDAVAALLDYCFRHLNMHRVWLSVLATNERAIRSYKACGFQEEVRRRQHVWIDGELRDEIMMGVLRAEWSG
jgi:RimJ/RimL family protein N-acetyltransferase